MTERRNPNIMFLIKFIVMLILFLSSLFTLLLVQGALGQDSEPLELKAEAVVVEKVVQYGFQNQGYEMLIRYSFFPNGSLLVWNSLSGAEFFFPQPNFQPDFEPVVSLYQNESHVVQHFWVNGSHMNPEGKAETLWLDLWVYFKFDEIEKNKAKISLVGTTNDTDSEIEYEFENPRGQRVQNTTTNFQIGNIMFDWEDLVIGATQFTFVLNKLKIKFDESFCLDPYIVSQVVSSSATRHNFERKIAYASSRWWVFYSDDSNIVYRTSVDGGATWTSSSTVASGTLGSYFSLWQHGNYVDYARHVVGVYYRRGLLNSDGSITWSVSEASVNNTGQSEHVAIVTDSDDYPYVIYENGNDHTIYVSKSTFNNGSWSTATGYPLQLNAATSIYWVGNLVALTSGKIYAIYTNASNVATEPWLGKLYDGSTWGSEEVITTTYKTMAGYSTSHSMVAVNNDVCFVFYSSDGSNYYLRRTYGVGWGSEGFLDVGYYPTLATSGADLYLFSVCLEQDGVYWRKYDSGSGQWGVDASSMDVALTSLSAMQTETVNKELAFIYTTYYSPYYVRFHKITTQEPTEWSDPGGGEPPSEPPIEQPQGNETGIIRPFVLPVGGTYVIIAAVGMVTIGGIIAAYQTTKSPRRHGPSQTRYSYTARPRQPPTRYVQPQRKKQSRRYG